METLPRLIHLTLAPPKSAFPYGRRFSYIPDMDNPQAVIARYQLEALPEEGGYFRRTFYQTGEASESSILFLVTREQFSAIHRIKSPEWFHFYEGDPVEQFIVGPDDRPQKVLLGADPQQGQQRNNRVPPNCWQGMRLCPGGEWALFGVTVRPAFEWEDFELGKRERLLCEYPDCRDSILALTRT